MKHLLPILFSLFIAAPAVAGDLCGDVQFAGSSCWDANKIAADFEGTTFSLQDLLTAYKIVGRLPAGKAIVQSDCTNSFLLPCYETFNGESGALASVEAADPTGNRVIKVGLDDYLEDVDCTPDDGYTTIIGNASIADASAGFSLPQIIGVTGGSACTITMSRCFVDKMQIMQGPVDLDSAVCTEPGAAIGLGRVANSRVRNYSVGGAIILGNGDRLVSLTHDTGTFQFYQSRIDALVAGCTGNCALIYQNTASDTLTEIIGGDHTLIELTPTNGGAFYELASGKVNLYNTAAVVSGNGTSTNSMFEVCSDDCQINIDGGWAVGGASTGIFGIPTLDVSSPRFITVVEDATPGGARIYMANVSGAEHWTVASSWGSHVVPIYRGPLETISVAFDADETDADSTSYVSLFDGTPNGAAATNVDDYVMATPFLARRLHVRVATAPDNGGGVQSWTYTLEDDDTDTALTCTISEAATSCDSANALDGPVTSVANNGGAAQITSQTHGLTTGDTIYIRGTTNYNGVDTVTVVDADTFDLVTDPYVADEAGDWIRYDAAAVGAAGSKLNMKIVETGAAVDDVETIISFGYTAFPQ